MRRTAYCGAIFLTLFTARIAAAADWPQQLDGADGSVVLIYPPQVEVISGNTLEGRAAVSVKRPTADNAPQFGAIWFAAELDAETGNFAQADLKHEPPVILFSREPALLVSIDGEPVYQTIEGSNYEHVVNSPYLIVRDRKRHLLYIGSNTWYDADSTSLFLSPILG